MVLTRCNLVKQCAKIGVDERVILGIIMQESHGDVGAPTTYSWEGVPTGGIMQCSGERGHWRQHSLPQVNTPIIRYPSSHKHLPPLRPTRFTPNVHYLAC